MHILTFAIGMVLLLAGAVVQFAPLPQAQVLPNTIFTVNSMSVLNPSTKDVILNIAIVNTSPNPVEFFHATRVFGDSGVGGLVVESGKSERPLSLRSGSINAGETKTFTMDISCVNVCATDGTYTYGQYAVSYASWQFTGTQDSQSCLKDINSFECSFTLLTPISSLGSTVITTTFVNKVPTQSSIIVLACYQYLVSILFNCSEQVPLSDGKTTPAVGTHSYIGDDNVVFTATPEETKSKFVKWIRHS